MGTVAHQRRGKLVRAQLGLDKEYKPRSILGAQQMLLHLVHLISKLQPAGIAQVGRDEQNAGLLSGCQG